MSIERGSGVITHASKEIGKSALDLPIMVYTPVAASDLLVMAGQHGEEPEGVVLLSKALRSINSPPKSHLILCANPDGALCGTRGNGNGVDLNRNFPSNTWSDKPVNHRWSVGTNQNTELSPGSRAGSESETLALINYLRTHQIKRVVTLHGPLACVDDPESSSLGKWLSEASGLPLVTDIGYPTPGSFGAWAAEQAIHVITYEFGPHSVWDLLPVHLPILQMLIQSPEDLS